MNIITTHDQLAEMVQFYLTQDAFAFDVETVGDRRGDTPVNEVLWITFSTHGRGDVIPLGHPNGNDVELVYPLTGQGQKRVDQGLPARPSDYSRSLKKADKVFSDPPAQLFPAEVFAALEPLLFNDKILTIGHNLVFDLTSVAKYYGGRIPSAPYFDTMVASFISDNRNKNKCSLKECLKREFEYEMAKGVGAKVEIHTFDDLAKYAYLDAKYTFLLWKVLVPKLEDAELTRLMGLEMDVLAVLCDMKLTGAMIDIEELERLDTQLKAEIEDAKAGVYKVAGRVFNINSNPEKQALLYSPKDQGGRGLTPRMLTTRGKQKEKIGEPLQLKDYSVAAEALELYSGIDPLIDALLTYTDLNKLHTTYVVPYYGGEIVRTTAGKAKTELKESLLIDGKIHCDFVQIGAETGRFSSRNPNLQNVPAPHTAHGKAIRNLFIAPEGYKLVVADYSQIEPRVIASMSEDPIMIENYMTGGDIYTTVGNTMGVERKAGKVLVLAMAYGVGPGKISRQIGCTVQEAADLLSRFSQEFPSVNRYRSKVIAYTRKHGYITTITKRRRYLPDISSSDQGFRASAERQAFNTRIQGSAADIIKMAMVRAHDMIPEGAKMILTVHDEIVTLTPEDKAEETAEAIREAMEGMPLLKVPLVADVKIVQRWGEAK